MKSIKKFLLITLAILMANTIYSQKVTGVVKVQKPNGSVEPISYASIYWLEEQEVFESNEKGLFSFDRRERDEVSLVATFVGHTQDTVVLSKDNNVAEFIIKEGAELEAARIITRQQGNYISKLSSVKTEVISAAGLCKMACCSLAESFSMVL